MRINFEHKPKPALSGNQVPKSLERKPIRSSLTRKGSLRKSDTKSPLSSSFLSLQNYDRKQFSGAGKTMLSSTKSIGSKGARVFSKGRSQSSQKRSAKKPFNPLRNNEKLNSQIKQQTNSKAVEPSQLVSTEKQPLSPTLDNKAVFSQTLSSMTRKQSSSVKRNGQNEDLA